jgi:hypothetical protein
LSIKWGWSEGLKKYTESTPFNDTDSQAIFGIKSNKDLEYKGVQADLSGQTVVNDRGTRFLARFSTPQVEIDSEALLKTYENNAGDKVLFSHPDIPQEGGGMGISTELELVSKGINWDTGNVKWKLVYTSYYNLRRGLIGPSSLISSVIDQKTFSIPVTETKWYKAGYFVRVWLVNAKLYGTQYVEIDSVNETTGQIILKEEFNLSLTAFGPTKLKSAKYNNASAEQQARFAYVSPTAGFFDDNTKSYQIAI